MNTTTSSTAPSTTDSSGADSSAGLAADDPRAVFAKAVALGGQVIAAVRPDQLDDATPCEGMPVRDLLAHLGSLLPRVAAIGRGENIFGIAPSVVDHDVAGDGWAALWADGAHQVQAVWSDDAVLDRTIVLPWATSSGAETLAGYTSEVTVHTWDLARATGQHPAWDDQVVEVGLGAIQATLPGEGRMAMFEAIQAGMPAAERTGVPPFAEAVAVPADAPLIDQLVAWTGRRP